MPPEVPCHHMAAAHSDTRPVHFKSVLLSNCVIWVRAAWHVHRAMHSEHALCVHRAVWDA
eukprot:67559-Pelagomonas_calceolata.AAC.1